MEIFDKLFCLFISSPRGSGKSTLLNFMLTDNRILKGKYAKVFIFSPTFEGDTAYSGISLPDDQIFDEILTESLEDIIELKMSDLYSEEDFLIVFDDIITKDINNETLKKIIVNGRHIGTYNEEKDREGGISIIISGQHIKSVCPKIRQNCSMIISFGMQNKNALKVLHEEYFARFTFKEFLKIFNFATKGKHDFIFNDGINIYKNFNKLKI